MILLAAVLALQAAAPCAAADRETGRGWDAYRRGSIPDAGAAFVRADSLCPGHRGAAVGLGFVRLREGRPREAERTLWAALRANPTLADAWYGLGLARYRLGRRDAAVIAWRRALRHAPDYREPVEQLLALGIDSGLAPPRGRRPATPRLAARTAGERFEVAHNGSWRPMYVRGVNLGAALPGRFPSDFPTADSTYDHWLRLMAEANANAVRLYTILPPAFYRSLRRWNDTHPERPLWLLQGVWAELPPRHDYDDATWKVALREEMRRAVDVVHGHAALGARRGHAWGRYDADVSDRVLGFILGREWEPFTIEAYNRLRADRTRYAGRFLAVARGTPADVWMAEQCDYVLTYEWDEYHAARPIAYTNWPTLDPLHHPSEPTRDEERAIRRRLGLATNPRLHEYDNDGPALDAMLVRTTDANRAGYFAAYHAYPYYPDFIARDERYAAGAALDGGTRYGKYLADLQRHHTGRPVLIAEYGVPSSRGVAHLEPDGRHHGGHDEAAMAAGVVQLSREIRGAGLAGGVLFSWLDEWFKHNWVVIDLELPAERNPLWHNVMDAEQQYGLLGQYAGAATRPEPGGPAAAWQALPTLATAAAVSLHVAADPAYLYVALEAPWAPDSTSYLIGIDTYDAARGAFRLPVGTPPPATSTIGLEFAATLPDTSGGELRVVPWYNPYLGPRPGMPPTGLDGFYHEGADVSRRADDGRYDSLFVTINRFRVTRDGRTFAAQGVNRGRLRFGRAAATSHADWYYDRAAGLIELRLPWGLLNVTDPSSHQVLARVTRRLPFATAQTDGFRFVVRAWDRRTGAARAHVAATPPFRWAPWATPVWHERLKPAYYAMQALWGSW